MILKLLFLESLVSCFVHPMNLHILLFTMEEFINIFIFWEAWKTGKGDIEIVSQLVNSDQNHIGFMHDSTIFLYEAGDIRPQTYRKGDKDYDNLFIQLDARGLVKIADNYSQKR